MTGDSIGLFLETECQFPLESEDECYYDDEEHEFLPRYRRQGCGLTKSFVKKASLELIGLYRRFVSPANPRFCCSFFSITFRGLLARFIWGLFRIPYHCTAPFLLPALVHIWSLSVLVSSPPPVMGPVDLGICRYDPRSLDTPPLIEFDLENPFC